MPNVNVGLLSRPQIIFNNVRNKAGHSPLILHVHLPCNCFVLADLVHAWITSGVETTNKMNVEMIV